MKRTKLAHSAESRVLLVLLRMSGRTQQECARIIGCTRQAISTEEQEARFKSQVQLLTSILARSVLPEHLHKHFAEPEYQDDFTQIKKRIYR